MSHENIPEEIEEHARLSAVARLKLESAIRDNTEGLTPEEIQERAHLFFREFASRRGTADRVDIADAIFRERWLHLDYADRFEVVLEPGVRRVRPRAVVLYLIDGIAHEFLKP